MPIETALYIQQFSLHFVLNMLPILAIIGIIRLAMWWLWPTPPEIKQRDKEFIQEQRRKKLQEKFQQQPRLSTIAERVRPIMQEMHRRTRP